MNRRTIISIPVGIILVAALVILGIRLFAPEHTVRLRKPTFTAQNAEQYLQGNELRMQMMQSYLDSCNLVISRRCKCKDTLLVKSLKEQLTDAIQWRKALESADIDAAVSHYFPKDTTLKNTLSTINPDLKESYARAMRDTAAHLSQMSLTEVNAFLSELTSFMTIRSLYERRSGLRDEPDNYDGEKWKNVANHLSKEECKKALSKLKSVHLPNVAVVTEFMQPLITRVGEEVADQVVAEQPSATQQPVAPVANQPYTLYKVQKGETLNAISRKLKIPLQELKDINGFSDEAADKIKADQEIRVPKK